MRRQWYVMVAAVLWAGGSAVQAGTLDPANPPGPTMHTLEDVYQKLLSEEQILIDIRERLLLADVGRLVSIETVTVGHAGNPDDTGGSNDGAVAYDYKMGKYEVTNGEYVEFLNAVDPAGESTLGLYNANMGNSAWGGISKDVGGAPGSTYQVKPGYSSKPVVYVSFYDAMRFCNWLHNGAVAGTDTEHGAYTLEGGTATPSNGTTVQRNAVATFAVPTTDEWYKAAYYEPGGDADNYWLYPTRSNTAPTAGAPPGIAPAANISRSVGTVTEVGAYNATVGYFGTYDIAGNVWEWNETLDGSARVRRGGSWGDGSVYLQSNTRITLPPGFEGESVGFRVTRLQ